LANRPAFGNAGAKIQIKSVVSYVKSDPENRIPLYNRYKCLLSSTPINLIIIDHQIPRSIYTGSLSHLPTACILVLLHSKIISNFTYNRGHPNHLVSTPSNMLTFNRWFITL
jgi:hypothetical protein